MLVNLIISISHDSDLWMLDKVLHSLLIDLWLEPIIAIHKGHQRAIFYIRKGEVSGGTKPPIWLMQRKDTWVSCGILIAYSTAAIGRTIIHQDDLQLLIALRKD